jgi:hypothetical protein
MREVGLSGLVPQRRATIRVSGVRVADDLVERDRPAAPDVEWVGHHLRQVKRASTRRT